jgi:hypothetical protein
VVLAVQLVVRCETLSADAAGADGEEFVVGSGNGLRSSAVSVLRSPTRHHHFANDLVGKTTAGLGGGAGAGVGVHERARWSSLVLVLVSGEDVNEGASSSKYSYRWRCGGR